MKILIIGSNGLLGKELKKVFSKEKNLFCPNKKELDVTNEKLISNYFEFFKPNVIINSAAFTNVDACEYAFNKVFAFKLNSIAPGLLAREAKKINAKIIHISSDYIFDGKKKTPYEIDDIPNPLNYYGYTKLIGEEEVKKNTDRYFILRTQWLYGNDSNNFVNNIINLIKNNEKIFIVNDQYGSPTYAKDLASSIYNFIHKKNFGTYHLTNTGYTNWFNFAKYIVKKINKNIEILPISSSNLNRKAERPKNSKLSLKSLIKANYFLPRSYKNAIDDFLLSNKHIIK